MDYSVGVYQNKNSNFSNIIKEIIADSKTDLDCSKIVFHAVDCPALFPDSLDICILESGFENSNSFPHADYVIVPDICNISTIKQLSPKSVVTYGLSCKNTITVSSLIDKQMVISIQRELVAITGCRIDPQEFPISLKDINTVEAILASVAILLILGISTEKIQSICEKIQPLHI